MHRPWLLPKAMWKTGVGENLASEVVKIRRSLIEWNTKYVNKILTLKYQSSLQYKLCTLSRLRTTSYKDHPGLCQQGGNRSCPRFYHSNRNPYGLKKASSHLWIHVVISNDISMIMAYTHETYIPSQFIISYHKTLLHQTNEIFVGTFWSLALLKSEILRHCLESKNRSEAIWLKVLRPC